MDWLSPIKELFGFLFPFLEKIPVIRALLGFILLFFLPGFTWSLVFFRRVSIIERVVLSIGLSIALVTLSLLFMDRLIGIRITSFSSVLVIILITIIPLIFYSLNRLVPRR